jgi:hypothetical protein
LANARNVTSRLQLLFLSEKTERQINTVTTENIVIWRSGSSRIPAPFLQLFLLYELLLDTAVEMLDSLVVKSTLPLSAYESDAANHQPRDEAENLVEDLQRQLRPGGRVNIFTHALSSVWNALIKLEGNKKFHTKKTSSNSKEHSIATTPD